MTRSVGELGRKRWTERQAGEAAEETAEEAAGEAAEETAGEEQPRPGQATSRRYRYARRVCNNDDDGDDDADCDSDSAVADTL